MHVTDVRTVEALNIAASDCATGTNGAGCVSLLLLRCRKVSVSLLVDYNMIKYSELICLLVCRICKV